ncbi:MAG: DUF1592 domain-containing protein, partial [Opitutales bacterium]
PLGPNVFLRFGIAVTLASSAQAAAPDFVSEVQPLLRQYCYDCHNNTEAKSDINFEAMASARAYLEKPDLLTALEWVVAEAEMPPIKHPAQPTQAERDLFVAWAELLLAEAQNASPNEPGRVVVPRLNHIEYNHVVRDITGFDIDVADIFPRDGGGGEGFANVGEAQSATPMQVEKFLHAAKEVVAHASVSDDGRLTWHPEALSAIGGPAARLDVLKEQWGKFHETFYEDLLGGLSELEGTHKYRFTPYIEVAWRYRHRAALGKPNASLNEIAESLNLEIPEIILEKWVSLMAKPQGSRYLDVIISHFNTLPAPGQNGMNDERIHHECVRMAKYLELYGRQELAEQWFPDVEVKPRWLSFDQGMRRTEARKELEDELHDGLYRFEIDLTQVENPEFLYVVTSPAGDGGEGDVVIWTKGEWDNGQKKIPWRWHPSVTLYDANKQPVYWGAHPFYKKVPIDSYGVGAPSMFLVKVPPGAKTFTVEARLDPAFSKNASVQLLIDVKPPERIDELPGRYIFGPPESEQRQRLLQATRQVRRAVFDHNIEKNRNFVFHDFPGLDPTRLDATEAEPPQPAPDRPFSLTVRELRSLTSEDQQSRLLGMAREIQTLLTPQETASTLEAARKVIQDLCLKAWRRPASGEEVDRLMGLYAAQRELGLGFEKAVKQTMVGILVDPNFLYRLQMSQNSEKPYPINDFELASRLSFTLWGSIPDDELIQLASNGRLRADATLRAQIARMLKDERAESLSESFAGHWLHFIGFEKHNAVDVERFGMYTPELRQAMADELKLFFADLIRNSGSVRDILFADYSFLNETLAEHYDIEGVSGESMRKVTYPAGTPRRGVITMGAILTATSKALRTSPVNRGDFIVEKVLGIEMPSPPDEVPMLSDDETNEAGLSLLEQLERHRASPACSSCHSRIDPVGLAMENFDPVGRWREKSFTGLPLVTAGTLANGREISGFEGLMSYLEDKEELFLDQLCRKFLGYALGRRIQITDQPLIDQMKLALTENDYRFGAMVEVALTSQQFRYRQDFRTEVAGTY